jgi:iron complex outermembrane receptor protein
MINKATFHSRFWSALLGCTSAAAILSLGVSTAAYAQAAGTNAQQAEEVIVTGTRDPSATASNSPSPITVIESAALESTGEPDLRDALVDISPSITRVSEAYSYANGIDKISMRGLPSDDTLILLNGIRRHTTATIQDGGGPENGTAPADLGMFPSSAIGHAEVLLDGASAQYGSSAIAGVVNLILREDDQGIEFSSNNGIYSALDGFTSDSTANAGFKLGSSGFVDFSAEYLHEDHTNRGFPDNRLAPTDIGYGTPINRVFGSPSQDKITLSYNAGIDLTDTVQLYSFSTYGHRLSATEQNYRLPSKLPQVFPNGFEPATKGKENDYASTVGLKGNLSGWAWNVSGTYGYDHTDFVTSDTVNLAYYADFGHTPTTVYNGAYGDSETTAQVDVTRSFDMGWAGPTVLAFGGQYIYDTYNLDAGELAAYYGGGTQGSGGFPPAVQTHAGRNVKAAYVDLAVKPFVGFQADFAGRFESYSDAGDTATGKVSLRYDFSDAVAIRGTMSNAFHAPSLQEQYFSSIAVTPDGDNGQVAVNSPAGKFLGSRPLKPETSTNYSVGLVLHPVDAMAITIDAYQIRIGNRIVTGGTYTGQTAIDAFALLGLGTNPGVDPAAVSASYFTNGADTKTQGIDIAAKYSTPFDGFKIDWDASANFSGTDIERIGNDLNGNPLLNAQQVSFITTATPRDKIIFGGDLTAGRFDANLHEIFWGGTTTLQQYVVGPNAYSNTIFYTQNNQSKWQTNVDLGYQVADQLRLSFGAVNLFSAKPTQVPQSTAYAGVPKYDLDSQQIGFNGAFYYTSLKLNL